MSYLCFELNLTVGFSHNLTQNWSYDEVVKWVFYVRASTVWNEIFSIVAYCSITIPSWEFCLWRVIFLWKLRYNWELEKNYSLFWQIFLYMYPLIFQFCKQNTAATKGSPYFKRNQTITLVHLHIRKKITNNRNIAMRVSLISKTDVNMLQNCFGANDPWVKISSLLNGTDNSLVLGISSTGLLSDKEVFTRNKSREREKPCRALCFQAKLSKLYVFSWYSLPFHLSLFELHLTSSPAQSKQLSRHFLRLCGRPFNSHLEVLQRTGAPCVPAFSSGQVGPTWTPPLSFRANISRVPKHVQVARGSHSSSGATGEWVAWKGEGRRLHWTHIGQPHGLSPVRRSGITYLVGDLRRSSSSPRYGWSLGSFQKWRREG